MLEATKCLQPCVGGSIVLSSFSRGAFPLDRCQVVSVAGLRKHTLRKEVGGFFFLFVCLGGFAKVPFSQGRNHQFAYCCFCRGLSQSPSDP